MDAKQFAAGMAKVSDYFGDQVGQAQVCRDRATQELAKKHKQKFIDYLERYGYVEFNSDFAQCYISYVLVLKRMSEPDFITWVDGFVASGQPLVTYTRQQIDIDPADTESDVEGLFR